MIQTSKVAAVTDLHIIKHLNKFLDGDLCSPCALLVIVFAPVIVYIVNVVAIVNLVSAITVVIFGIVCLPFSFFGRGDKSIKNIRPSSKTGIIRSQMAW